MRILCRAEANFTASLSTSSWRFSALAWPEKLSRTRNERAEGVSLSCRSKTLNLSEWLMVSGPQKRKPEICGSSSGDPWERGHMWWTSYTGGNPCSTRGQHWCFDRLEGGRRPAVRHCTRHCDWRVLSAATHRGRTARVIMGNVPAGRCDGEDDGWAWGVRME